MFRPASEYPPSRSRLDSRRSSGSYLLAQVSPGASDDDLINAMADALLSCPSSASADDCDHGDNNAVGGSGASRRGSANSAGAFSSNSNKKKMMKVVGGGQGLLPPDIMGSRESPIQKNARSAKEKEEVVGAEAVASNSKINEAGTGTCSASGQQLVEEGKNHSQKQKQPTIVDQYQMYNARHPAVYAQRRRGSEEDGIDDLCNEIAYALVSYAPAVAAVCPSADGAVATAAAAAAAAAATTPVNIPNKCCSARLDNDVASPHNSSVRSRSSSKCSTATTTASRCSDRPGSPIDAFCTGELPPSSTNGSGKDAGKSTGIAAPPIETINPHKIKIGKKIVVANKSGGAPSVVSTSASSSYESGSSNQSGGAAGGGVITSDGVADLSALKQEQLGDAKSAERVEQKNMLDLSQEREETLKDYNNEEDDDSNDNKKQQPAKRKGLLGTASESTITMSNVHGIIDLLEEEEDEKNAKDGHEREANEAKKMETEEMQVEKGNKMDENDDDNVDDKSINLEEAFDSDKKPKELDADNTSDTRINNTHRSHGSSLSHSVNLAASSLSLEKNASSSNNSKRRSFSSSSGNNLNDSLTLSEQDTLQSFQITTQAYQQRYQRCKNRALFHNLDRTIESSVVAPLPEDGRPRTKKQQDKANVMLRRRVRMCFAAMVVVFGNGLEDDPTDSLHERGFSDCDFHDSFASINDDASVLSGQSGFTQFTTTSYRTTNTQRSTISSSSKSRSRRHRRRGSGATSSELDNSTKAPSIKRPSIPLAVARLLWTTLIRRRGGLDLDPDYTDSAEKDNAIEDPDVRAERAQTRIEVIVDEIQEALVSTLALVDVITNFDEDDTTVCSGGSSSSHRSSHRRRRCHTSLGTDCAAVASNVSGESLGEADICLFVNHDIHQSFGCSIAIYCPDLFFESQQAYERYLYKNVTTMSSWDPELELNYDMADACLSSIRRRHSSSPTGGKPSSAEYRYALEAAPMHLLACGRYGETMDLLAKTSYVRRKLLALGILKGTKAHITDVEEMNEVVADAGSSMDMGAVFVTSFQVIYDVLTTIDDQANINAKGLRTRRKYDKLLSSQIEIAESLHAMGASLQEHGFDEDAVDAYLHALERFDKVHTAVIRHGAEGEAAKLVPGKEGLYLPSIDHIQFITASSLAGIAHVYDESGKLDDATLHYERALSYYSKQRSLRHRNGVANTLTTIGILNFRQREWDIAAANFDEALCIFQSLEVDGDKGEEIGDIYQWMGNIRREAGEHESALALFTEAFYIITLKFGKSHPRVGRIHQSMAIIHDDLGEFDDSLTHYKQALKIRKKAVAKSSKDALPASVEELAVAETLMCMGNVYRVLEQYDKAYQSYFENALIMRLDVCALLHNSFLSSNSVLEILAGEKNNKESLGTVNILYNRLMMALDMARRMELTDKESAITDDEHCDSRDGDEDKFVHAEQVAGLLYDVGAISAAKYLQRIDSDDPNHRFEQVAKQREEAMQCFEEVISIRKERLETLSKLFGNDYSSEDHGATDEKLIIAYSYYEIAKLFGCTFFARQRRHGTDSIDDASSRDVTSALAAFCESKELLSAVAESIPHAPDELLEECIDPAVARAKKANEVVEDMTNTMAVLYRETDQHEKALDMYNDVLRLHSNNDDINNTSLDDASYHSMESIKISREEKVAQAIEDVGNVLLDQGDNQKALEHFSEVLELRISTDEAGLSVANTLRVIGRIYLQQKQWDLAIKKFEEELRILLNLLDEYEPMISHCFHSIGKAYEGTKDFAQALDYFKRARNTMGDAVGSDLDIHCTHLLFDTGNIILQMDKATSSTSATALDEADYDLALKCLSQAYKGYCTNFGIMSVESANSMFMKGELFYSREEYETAISCFEESLRVYGAVMGEEHIKCARTLNLIGLCHLESGADDERAMECFDACLAILQQEGHGGSEDHACVLFYKAAAHEKKEQLDLAIVCYEGSLQYYRKLLGEDNIKVASVLEKLGTALLNDREPEQAKKHLEDALRIRKTHRADNDLEAAELYYGLGIVYCEKCNYNKSLDNYERAFNIRQEILGETHVEVAQVLNNVGSVFARGGHFERAVAPWNDALQMYRDAGLGFDNERVGCTLANIETCRNLVSVQNDKAGTEGGGESSIRTFLIY